MSQETALQRHRQDYSDYLPLTERLQEDLRADVDILRAQEGWDQGTVLGVEEWVGDRGGIWRAFRVRTRNYVQKLMHAAASI